MCQRLMAEAYILRTIGELDETTEKALWDALRGAPYESLEEFFSDFEAEEAVSEALVEWIEEEWKVWQSENPGHTPQKFAKARLPEFLSALE